MDNFWANLPKPFFILAPMEAVTDVVFRHVVIQAGAPDVFFTEFTSTAAFFSDQGRHSTNSRLEFTDDEQPIVAQIWGNDPEKFEFMARELKKRGFAGIDINMGCPAGDIVKTGGGSGMIRTPETAIQAIQATKKAGLPVSVKTRLGYSSTSEWKEWLTILLKQDIVNLTIHLRTRKEMSKVDAHFEMIPDILKLRDEIAPHTLITINGDIRDRTHALELVKKYPGIDGIMIGRGIFHDIRAFDTSTDVSNSISNIELLKLHLNLFDQHNTDDKRPFDPLKRFFKIYVKGFDGAAELRDQLMHCKTTDEVRKILG